MNVHFLRIGWVRRAIGLASLFSALLIARPLPAVEIEFDYSYDKEGFFDDPARRELLELAGRFVNRYVDRLEPIVPTDENSWFTFAPVPADQFLFDMEIPADTLKVIALGNSVLPGNNLSQTTAPPASVSPGTTPTAGWEDLLASRGQAGVLESPATDYANWGGAMNVNSDDVKWHFGRTTEGLDSDETDFLTLAMHELSHVFGFGPSDSFTAQVDGIVDGVVVGDLKFAGPEALSVGSGTNPQLRLHDGGHWASNTVSFAGGHEQKALMTPAIYEGERKYPTLLDRAALRDVGWQEARPGDVNLDGQFDTRDIVAISQAATYRSGEIVPWSDGDWNDDMQFDQRDIIAALADGTYLTGPYTAVAEAGAAGDGQTSVIYDAATGAVAVEPSDAIQLTSVNLESKAGIFTGDPAVQLGGMFDVDEDTDVFKATIGSSFGAISFGRIAEPGLDEAFLLGDLTVTGSLAGGGSLGDVDLIYLPVPEPATWILATLGLVALLFRRAAARRGAA